VDFETALGALLKTLPPPKGEADTPTRSSKRKHTKQTEGRKMSSWLVALAASLLATTFTAADLSGVWTLSWQPDFGGNLDAYDCTFKQNGRTLTVNCRDDPAMTGEVDERKVTLRFKAGRDGRQTATLTGELDQSGITITGAWHLSEPENRDGKFVARKQF
jgi:hypothetical protein